MLTSLRHARRAWIAGLLCSGTLAWGANAKAEQPSGCDGSKWPLTQEASAMRTAGTPPAADTPVRADASAYRLTLLDQAQAHLPKPPERPSRVTPSKAGYLRFERPAGATIQITISDAAWIDVIQDEAYVKPSAFTEARDCPGVRKSVRFRLAPMPFVVQVSGTSSPAITLVASPVPDKEHDDQPSK